MWWKVMKIPPFLVILSVPTSFLFTTSLPSFLVNLFSLNIGRMSIHCIGLINNVRPTYRYVYRVINPDTFSVIGVHNPPKSLSTNKKPLWDKGFGGFSLNPTFCTPVGCAHHQWISKLWPFCFKLIIQWFSLKQDWIIMYKWLTFSLLSTFPTK